MKYLEISEIDTINQVLSHIETLDGGKLDCKFTAAEKKLYKKLNEEYDREENRKTVLGEWKAQTTRKLFFYLTGTLNNAFPDYNFTDLSPKHFEKHNSLSDVINSVNTALFNSGLGNNVKSVSEFGQNLWETIDSSIELNECEIYSYTANFDFDPFSDDGYM